MMQRAEMLAETSGSSAGVIWGLIGASVVLEIIVFAVCVASTKQPFDQGNHPSCALRTTACENYVHRTAQLSTATALLASALKGAP